MCETFKIDHLRPLGSTDRRVTPIGLGGEGVLRTHGRTAEAKAVIAMKVLGDGYYVAPA